MKAQKVQLHAKELGNELAEAIKKHFWRNVIFIQHGQHEMRRPGCLLKQMLQVGQHVVARHQQHPAKISGLKIIQNLLERVDLVWC